MIDLVTRRLLVPVVSGLLVVAIAPGRAESQTVMLEGGRIIPVVGRPLERGSILIKDGLIVEIGPEIETPFDAKVVDVSGKTLFPGMIDVETVRGMDIQNESSPVTPYLNVYDAIDPSQLFFEDSLRDGVTSIHVAPGNNTVIGGLSRVVHPIGMTPEQMTTAADVALKVSITPKRGFDRMLQMATFRETFRKLDEDMENLAEKLYEEKLRKDEKDLDVPPDEARKRGRELIKQEDIPEKDRNLLLLTQGKLRTLVYCGNAMDVSVGIRLAKKHGFFDKCVLVIGTECFKAIDVLKDADRPIILPYNLVHTDVDPITGEEKETFVPSVLDKAGLKFALRRNAGASLGERYLWYQAARCVREGIKRSRAIKAITLWPAEMLGLGDRLGSLEAGKDANILVLSGDPLDAQTWVENVYVQGIAVYDRDEDIRLKRLLAPPKEEPSASSKPGKPTTSAKDDKDSKKPRRRRGAGRRGGRGRRGPQPTEE